MKELEVTTEQYESIAKLIHSDKSPVGIDAKKTHILILEKLIQMDQRLERIEKSLQQKSTQE